MSKGSCKVLVVDDDDENRHMLVATLEQAGYFPLGAEDGAKAIARLEDGWDPDLILTDLMMPQMNGWDLCEALKACPAWRSIPIIVLCGMSADQRGKLLVDDAFEKPTQLELLLNRIAELCGV